MAMDLDYRELSIIAAALELYGEEQQSCRDEIGDGPGRRSARVHVESEIEQAEALLRRINEMRHPL